MNVTLNGIEGEIIVHDVLLHEAADVLDLRYIRWLPVAIAVNDGVGVILILACKVIEGHLKDLATAKGHHRKTEPHVLDPKLHGFDVGRIGTVFIPHVAIIEILIALRICEKGEKDKGEKEKGKCVAHHGRQR